MANSQLRLDIITALDNAGIKATKDQIDGLEKTLQKVSKNDAFYGLDKSMTKLPGALGKIAEKFGVVGKAIGSVSLAVAAFKEGWDIGTWINDKVVTPLFGIKDANEELIKSNRQAAEAHRQAIASFELGYEAVSQKAKDEISDIDAQIKKNDELRQAYLRSAQAKNDFYNIGKDVEIQRLERERFEDILQLEAAGDYEGAKQANALYDFYRKQIEAKKEIEQFDRDTEALLEKQTAELEKQDAARDKVLAKENEIFKLRKAIDELGEKATSAAEYDKGERKLLRKISVAQKELDALRVQEQSLQELDDAQAQEMQNRMLSRAVLLDKLTQDVDYTAAAYDKAALETGNVLGISFDPKFTEELADNSKNSYGVLKSIDETMKAIRENQDNPWRMR